jgi:hypothetical protein
MINGTAVRIGVVALLIPVTLLCAKWVQASLDVPGTEMPDWTFHAMPMQLGAWRGIESKMDPKIAVQTGAKLDTIIERSYHDDSTPVHVIGMHAAMFDNPAAGVIHSPLVCYNAAGWKKLSEKRGALQLPVELTKLPDKLVVPVSISTWEDEVNSKKVMVVYWYQVGEHYLFGRLDLGIKIRWALAGKKWPALMKVMMEIPIVEGDDPQLAVLDFAQKVAGWLNQSSRRNGKGMLGVQAKTSSGAASTNP